MFDEIQDLSEKLSAQNRQALEEAWPELLKFHKLTDDEAGDRSLMEILRQNVAERLEPLGVSDQAIEKVFRFVFPTPARKNGKRVFI